MWGAAWLHKATRNPAYLHYIQANGQTLGADEGDNTFGWDNKHVGARILLSKVTFLLTTTPQPLCICGKQIFIHYGEIDENNFMYVFRHFLSKRYNLSTTTKATPITSYVLLSPELIPAHKLSTPQVHLSFLREGYLFSHLCNFFILYFFQVGFFLR